MAFTASRWFKNLLALAWITFCVVGSDIALGWWFHQSLVLHQDERNLTYRYDPELGWFPVANSKKVFTGSRTIHVEHNSRGFRDAEHVVGAKPRLIVLGDSFVWGYDVEQSERFTEHLRVKLRGWSIYNLGVSGYGTDQEFLLLEKHYDFYRPDIVFVLFCTDNDDDDNRRNVRYGVYYKPYFTVDGANLSLRGVPVPKSENYFFAQHKLLARSNWLRLILRSYFILTAPSNYVAARAPTHEILVHLKRYIHSQGGRLLIGLQASYPALEKFLIEQEIPYVDLTNPYRYPTQSRHWTPEGHIYVSDKIAEFLSNGKFISGISKTNAKLADAKPANKSN